MPAHRLELFPPGHPDGAKTLWLWQVCSTGDVVVSGTSDDIEDAVSTATSALLDVMGEQA